MPLIPNRMLSDLKKLFKQNENVSQFEPTLTQIFKKALVVFCDSSKTSKVSTSMTISLSMKKVINIRNIS